MKKTSEGSSSITYQQLGDYVNKSVLVNLKWSGCVNLELSNDAIQKFLSDNNVKISFRCFAQCIFVYNDRMRTPTLVLGYAVRRKEEGIIMLQKGEFWHLNANQLIAFFEEKTADETAICDQDTLDLLLKHQIISPDNLRLAQASQVLPQVQQDLADLINSPIVTLRCDKQMLLVHRDVLAKNSSFFEKTINSGMRETDSNEIQIDPSFSFDAWRAVISYMYSQHIDLTDNTLFEVVALADQYGMPNLLDHCGYALVGQITKDNVDKFLELAKQYNWQKLGAHCSAFKLNQPLRGEHIYQETRSAKLTFLSKGHEVVVETREQLVKEKSCELNTANKGPK